MSAAAKVAEKIEREKRSRRLYYCGRFGNDANFDDPLWHHYDKDSVPALHEHRSPFAIGAPTFGIKDFRANRAAGSTEAVLPEAEESQRAVPSFKEFRAARAAANRAAASVATQLPAASSSLEQLSVPPKSSPLRSLAEPRRLGTSRSAADVLEEAGRPPPTGLSRHSASARELLPATSYGRQGTASVAQTQASRQSLRSHLSAASLRSRISEAVQKELARGNISEEVQKELARSELRTYYEACEDKKQRGRQAQIDMPLHLRTGVDAIQMGCPNNYTTQQMQSLSLPIQMMTDPKWSTDIKKMNNKIGLRLEWEKKMSASLTGSISPELKFMPPKSYISNPPTPFFVPGKAEEARRR